MVSVPTVNLALTGANIVSLRKAAGLTVHDLQAAFGFNSPQAIYKWQNGAALPTVDIWVSHTGKSPANIEIVAAHGLFRC